MLSEHESYYTTILLLLAFLGNMEVPSPEGKGFNNSTADYASIHTEGTDQPDLSYLVFDTQFESALNGNIPMEQPLSQESLKDTLKKQLEFCLSR